jgi:RNA polymerase sigma factor (sigma-70 family)
MKELSDAEIISMYHLSQDARMVAFDFFYKKNKEYGMALLRIKQVPSKDIQDIVQEAFIILDKKILEHQYQLEKSSLKNYFLGICSHLYLSYLKKKRHHQSEEEIPPTLNQDSDTPEHIFMKQQLSEMMELLLEKLGGRCYGFLKDYYYHLLKDKEIAEKYRISNGNVRKSKFECLKKLRTIVDAHPELKLFLSR